MLGSFWSFFWAYNEQRRAGVGGGVALLVASAFGVASYLKPNAVEPAAVVECKAIDNFRQQGETVPPELGLTRPDLDWIERECLNYLADTAE
ncbi:hypothetical protein RZ532_03370 [Nitratireductor aquimarinus]|uniref:hypothetical protein n=1 Tax=Nitratireductor aquimarinus TaxID=889300 RepID=UPI002935B0F1|nr:hypothetical protein [Nitratireductor aquimarinus]MDV2965000.1 hypothetical protein [Nitratireductor aquimarinus]